MTDKAISQIITSMKWIFALKMQLNKAGNTFSSMTLGCQIEITLTGLLYLLVKPVRQFAKVEQLMENLVKSTTNIVRIIAPQNIQITLI